MPRLLDIFSYVTKNLFSTEAGEVDRGRSEGKRIKSGKEQSNHNTKDKKKFAIIFDRLRNNNKKEIGREAERHAALAKKALKMAKRYGEKKRIESM